LLLFRVSDISIIYETIRTLPAKNESSPGAKLKQQPRGIKMKRDDLLIGIEMDFK